MNKIPVILLLVILGFSACKKNIYTFDESTETLDVEEVDFVYLSAKVKVDFQDESNDIKLSTDLRLRKDSIIWFSASKGPYEVARGIFTVDSVVFLDKHKKTYSIFSFEELSKKLEFELDFKLIQSAIVGNLIFPYEKGSISNGEEFYNFKRREGRFIFDNYIGKNSMKLEKLVIQDMETQHNLQVDYKNFQQVDEQVFPYEVFSTFNYFSKNTSKNRKTIVNITFNKAAIENKSLRFPFRIPQKYDKK